MSNFNQTDILVVDDTPDNVRLLIDILQIHGCKVRPATNGNRALAVAQADPPDLILLDILMPGIDGYSVCQQLKADQRTQHIPVIFLSALSDALDKVKAFQVGGADYITKPFQAEEVLARIEHQLQIQHLSQQLAAENARLQQEIQERLAVEAQLEKAKIAAEVANQAKSDFLASMSHEIRTPMNAILGFCDLLQQLVTEPRQKTYVESIATSGNLLLALINDILDLSKIEAGKLQLHYEPLNVRKLVEEMRQIFYSKAQERNLELITEISERMPKGICFDEVRLRQILFNIVGNALKFTHQGFVKISVDCQRVPGNDSEICLEIEVEDTGIGIASEYQSSIFESFVQVDGCASRKYNGTGLGLTITARLTKLLGGKIQVNSELNKGSIFQFSFPQVKVIDTLPCCVETANNDDYDLTKFHPATLLVIDDVQLNLDLISSYFEQTNHRVLTANTGEIGLKLAQQEQPDLILLDWRMPGMDGQQVAETLKANVITEKIPIIVLTAANVNQIQNHADHLVDGFLGKPVSRYQLFIQLKRFLSLKKLTLPHQLINHQTIKSCELNFPENLSELLEKLDKLEALFFPELAQKMITGEIRKFTMQLLGYAQEYQCSALLHYAQSLEIKLQQFDIDGISQLIQDFPQFKQSLKLEQL